MVVYKDCETCKDFCNCNCDDLVGRVYLQRYGRDCYVEENTKANNKAVNMTHLDEIKKMNADELAKFLVDESKFPNSPCYLCEHDEGLNCASPVTCTEEYRASVYKKWLESEANYGKKI